MSTRTRCGRWSIANTSGGTSRRRPCSTTQQRTTEYALVQGRRLVPLPPEGAGDLAGRAGSVGGRWGLVEREPDRGVRARPCLAAAHPGLGTAGARAGLRRALATRTRRIPLPRLDRLQPDPIGGDRGTRQDGLGWGHWQPSALARRPWGCGP